MYTLQTPLYTVKGIGPKMSEAFAARQLFTVKDVLLFVPLRYEDRSQKKMIYQLQVGELVTVEAEVISASNFYKGRRSMQSAMVKDHTGQLKLFWFNNPHVVQRLQKGVKVLVSGKLNERGGMTQPTVELYTDDAIHTGRLVPMYSGIEGVAPALLRRRLKTILDNLNPFDNSLETAGLTTDFLSLHKSLFQIHFPDSEQHIIQARERFALEELLALIQHSQHLKQQWQAAASAHTITIKEKLTAATIGALPFQLTTAQHRCIAEIFHDLNLSTPMNRLLIGDVGSGKTAVAGVACVQVLANKHHAVLAAPTQILAEQHFATIQKLFPQLHTELITSRTNSKNKNINTNQPTLFIGTHAVFNHLSEIQPALLIYDEQHRFGVTHRSLSQKLKHRPHLLTLSATPIPRTLMLTIFAHLNLSIIDEMPPGRLPVKTWLVPETKRDDALTWLTTTLQNQVPAQAFIICPFIDPSKAEALENVAAATEMLEKMQKFYTEHSSPQYSQPRLALLHGRMSKKEQTVITDQLYKKEIDILVTTPIVEVGIDLPAASIIVIEAAERFGLASLHQLRGRVGRAGQQGYCLLFTNSVSSETKKRLQQFCTIHEGMKLAEMDLQRRGAGDIFGTQQHGFDDLQFANWTNLDLIAKAKKIADEIQTKKVPWEPFFLLKKDEESPLLAN